MKGINIAGSELTRKTDILDKFQHDNDFYYLLGLIATDGNVANDSSVIRIGLSHQDIDCLESLYNKFGGNIISYRKEAGEITNNPEYVVWSVIDYKLRKFLENIGITARKSLTLNINNYFETLTPIQQGFFMRGVIDGDGSVMIAPNSKKTAVRARICIGTGSEKFANMIKKFANELVVAKTKAKLTGNPFWILTATDANFIKLYDRCYYNTPSQCRLARKYTLTIKLAELQNKKIQYNHQRSYTISDGNETHQFKSIQELTAFLEPYGITNWNITNKNFGEFKLIYSAPTCQILTEEFFNKYPEIPNPLQSK